MGGEYPADPKQLFCKSVAFLKRYAWNDDLLNLLAGIVGTFDFYKEMLCLIAKNMSEQEFLQIMLKMFAIGNLSQQLELVRDEMNTPTLVGGKLTILIGQMRKIPLLIDDDDLIKFIIATWSFNINASKECLNIQPF